MSEDNKIQHEIHLAKHEGYDIDRPTHFFQKYGPYVLTMMQMIKYGVTVAGIIVPPLALFKLVEGVEAAQKTLDIAKKDITPLVDDTITYIKGQSNKADVDSEPLTTVSELDRLEVLEGADLRQLESFLKIKDGNRVLGNLYRIITPEGHVKWVCIDHYRENYRETAVQQLRDIVTANGGTFLEERGSVDIQILSRTRAAEFYSALVKARGIQELDIELEWDVTLDDLRKFSDAITNANILDLTVYGGHWEGPALDVINRGRRYDPLIRLMSNGRLRALRLKWCLPFFSHVSTSFTMMASQLQVLEIEVGNYDKEIDIGRVVPRILEGCYSLIHLTLYIDDMWLSLSLGLVIKTLGKMKRLEKLTVRRSANEEEVVVMRASEGRIESAKARFPSLKQIKKSDQEFIAQGFLTNVAVGIDYGEEALLLNVLLRNPLISHFQIECVDASVPTVIETVTLARIAVLKGGNASALQKLEVVAKDSEQEYLSDIASTVEFQGNDKTPIMSFNVKKFGWRYLRGSDYLDVLFSQYGSSLEELKVMRISDKHAQFLDNATKENGSKLISLDLDLASLTEVGLESMVRVIERSHSLRELGLHLDSSNGSQLEKAKDLFGGYSDRITGLYLTGYSGDDPKIKELCPTRHLLPEFSDFRLDYRPWRKVVEAIDFSALESLSFRYSNFGLDDLKMLVDRISDYGDFEVPLVTLDLFQTNVGRNNEQLERLKTMMPLVEIL
ncbi:hypothetical protein BGZ58_000882 [Dissophora ornata]|nr:hypothetical protein BGZ58_000882 [Dissophora ornata]